MHDPEFDSIDWNASGKTYEEIDALFTENPWKMHLITQHGTPMGIVLLETYAATFAAASRSSDVVIRSLMESKGGSG